MIKIEITEQQYKNLLVFLSRVSLTGTESFEYVNLFQTIRNSAKDIRKEMGPSLSTLYKDIQEGQEEKENG
jgi:hypothetical protein